MLVFGCQKDDLSGFEDSEKLAITLSGGIEQEMVSRVNDEGFCDEDVMGVYIVDYEGENPGELQLDGIRASNVRFTYDEAANYVLPMMRRPTVGTGPMIFTGRTRIRP